MQRLIVLSLISLISLPSLAQDIKDVDLTGIWQLSGSYKGKEFNHELIVQKTEIKINIGNDINRPFYTVIGPLDPELKIIGITIASINGVERLVILRLNYFQGPQEGYRLDDESAIIIKANNNKIILGKTEKDTEEIARLVRVNTIRGPSTALSGERD